MFYSGCLKAVLCVVVLSRLFKCHYTLHSHFTSGRSTFFLTIVHQVICVIFIIDKYLVCAASPRILCTSLKKKRPYYVISMQNGHIIAGICSFGWLMSIVNLWERWLYSKRKIKSGRFFLISAFINYWNKMKPKQ